MTSRHTDSNARGETSSRFERGLGAGVKGPTKPSTYPSTHEDVQCDDDSETEFIDALLGDDDEAHSVYQARLAEALASAQTVTSYKKMLIADIAKEFVAAFNDAMLQRFVPALNKGREPAYLRYSIKYDKYATILGKSTEKVLKNGIRMYSEHRPTRVITKSETQQLRDEICKISLQRDRLITRSRAMTTTDEVVRSDFELCNKTLAALQEQLGKLSEQKTAPTNEFPHRVHALKLALEIFSYQSPTGDALLKTIKQQGNPEAYRRELMEIEAERIAEAEAKERLYQAEKLAREAEKLAQEQPRYSGKELEEYERTKALLRDKKFIPSHLKKYEADAQKFIDQPSNETSGTKDQESLEKTKDLVRRNQFVPNHLLRFKADAEKCIREEKIVASGPSEDEINKVKELQASKKFIPANLRHVVKYLSAQVADTPVVDKSVELPFVPVKGNGAWETPISLDVVRSAPLATKVVEKVEEILPISVHPQIVARPVRPRVVNGRVFVCYDSDGESCYDDASDHATSDDDDDDDDLGYEDDPYGMYAGNEDADWNNTEDWEDDE